MSLSSIIIHVARQLSIYNLQHPGHSLHEIKLLNSFMVWLLEKGRKLYGVGSSKQVCVILDRGDYKRPDGVVKNGKHDKIDWFLLGKLIKLYSMLYSTINVSVVDMVCSSSLVDCSCSVCTYNVYCNAIGHTLCAHIMYTMNSLCLYVYCVNMYAFPLICVLFLFSRNTICA